jgi:hypothetical protein
MSRALRPEVIWIAQLMCSRATNALRLQTYNDEVCIFW